MIAVLGAGPHGRQLAAVLMPVYGSVLLYDDRLPHYPPIEANDSPYVIGAAWPKVRKAIAGKAPGEALNDGTVTFPGAVLGDDVRVGSHTHIGFNSVIAHGVTLGDFVTVCPGAVVSGEATVEDGVFIGANATVVHGGIKIGTGAIIGAGSVVLDNVPPGMVYAGNPARYIRCAS